MRLSGTHGQFGSYRLRHSAFSTPSPVEQRGLRLAVLAAVLLLAGTTLPLGLRAQQQGEHKIPVIGKTIGGNTRQAFTGKLESVDTKLKILNVKAAESTSTEIFPVKKDVEIRSAEGKKLKLDEIKVGTDIIVYYQQKGGQRRVKEIILLAPGKKREAEKKSPPRSS